MCVRDVCVCVCMYGVRLYVFVYGKTFPELVGISWYNSAISFKLFNLPLPHPYSTKTDSIK